MTLDIYTDPPDYKQIANLLTDISNITHVFSLIDSIFPSWIIEKSEKYSQDYAFLTENWKRVCSLNNTSPTQIILVDSLIFDDNHKLIQIFCNLLTTAGYCIRRRTEFQTCKYCNTCIPSESLYYIMKNMNTPTPLFWSAKCQHCM
jgi:hypothetical protein